jgi:hypothetical protein
MHISISQILVKTEHFLLILLVFLKLYQFQAKIKTIKPVFCPQIINMKSTRGPEQRFVCKR